MSTGSRLVLHALLPSLLLILQPVLAQGEPVNAVEPFAAIEKEYADARKAWLDSYRKASKAGASKQELDAMAARAPDAGSYAGRAMKVLAAKAASDEGRDTAIWLIRAARVHGTRLERALEVLQQHHLDSEKLTDIMLALSRTPVPSVALFLGKVHSSSDSIENCGRAWFALGQHLATKAAAIRSLAMNDESIEQRYIKTCGREAVDVLKAADAGLAEKRAGECYEEVIRNEDFAAIKYFGQTLGQNAERALFEIRHLSVGKVAPDIVGEDIDGVAMKLSDYRGKVVVIDFWGDW